jgi:hypothetical protein
MQHAQTLCDRFQNGCRNDQVKAPQMYQFTRVFWGIFGKSLEKVSCCPLCISIQSHSRGLHCIEPSMLKRVSRSSVCIPSYGSCVPALVAPHATRRLFDKTDILCLQGIQTTLYATISSEMEAKGGVYREYKTKSQALIGTFYFGSSADRIAPSESLSASVLTGICASPDDFCTVQRRLRHML